MVQSSLWFVGPYGFWALFRIGAPSGPPGVLEQGNSVSNHFDVSGRCVLVTGASSGLGRHFAALLAGQGAHVIAAARRTDKLESLVTEITAAGGKALAVECDVTSVDSVKGAFAAAEAEIGVVDIIINNAGITLPSPVLETSLDDWQAVIDTNLTGAWNVAQESARRLIAAGKPGSIINIASVAGFRPMRRVAAYAASKAALIHLTRTLAVEWVENNIRVNALAPGFFPSELSDGYLESDRGKETISRVPMERPGKWPELDGPLLLLASDAGSYMTGAILSVDGGLNVAAL